MIPSGVSIKVPPSLQHAPAALTHATISATKAMIAKHGVRSCEMPRRAAGLHEAGHAVVFAVLGIAVSRVEVQRRRDLERASGFAAWGGWCTHDELEARGDDAFYAATNLAGWRAECLFAGSALREGSSLDERCIATFVCGGIAAKTGRSPVTVLATIGEWVDRMLTANEATVRAIGRKLMDCKVIEGARLAELLRDVAPSGGGLNRLSLF
jgi:hypothetical protein